MMAKIVVALFLAAHGLIHLGYVTPAPPDPNYPFRLNQSWLITSLGMETGLVRLLGMSLGVVTVLGFALASLAWLNVVPQALWQPLTVISSIASIVLLVCFWHSWLVLGIVIDAALLIAVLGFGWKPFVAA